MSCFDRNRQSLIEKGFSRDRLPPGPYYTERYPVLSAKWQHYWGD
jgi:hypothetical protein